MNVKKKKINQLLHYFIDDHFVFFLFFFYWTPHVQLHVRMLHQKACTKKHYLFISCVLLSSSCMGEIFGKRLIQQWACDVLFICIKLHLLVYPIYMIKGVKCTFARQWCYFKPWPPPPPQYFNTDRSKAVLLLWFLAVSCSCCPYLYFSSAIMLMTYFLNFR